MKKLTHMLRRPGFLLVLAAIWLIAGAVAQSTFVNTDPRRTDQAAYLNTARLLRKSNFQHVTNRNRMPLYPSILGLFYHDGMSRDEFFGVGKVVGIGLSFLVCGLVFFAIRTRLATPEAWILTGIAAATVLVNKGPYCQADVLFYGLSFAAFILMTELFLAPRWWTAPLLGATAALAHLTKASVLPGLLLCAGWLVALAGARLIQAIRSGAKSRASIFLSASVPLLHTAVLLAVFLGVLSPYLRTSKERFGQYFYNVNSTFYIWCDSWQEIEGGIKAAGDRRGWPDLPPGQLPSAARYFREHGPAKIAGRLAYGAGEILKNLWGSSRGLLLFLTAYAVLLGNYIWRRHRDLTCAALDLRRLFCCLFSASYFGAYLLLYAFYGVVSSGNRFVLALALPALYVAALLLQSAQRAWGSAHFGKRLVGAAEARRAFAFALAIYMLTFFPYESFRSYRGI